MNIQEHMTLEMYNVLSYRAKMSQLEFAHKGKEIEQILSAAGASKNGPTVTTTFSVQEENQEMVMDVEILIPLERKIVVPNGFVWKPHFLLTNALRIQHIGNPATLQNSANELNTYITAHQLVPISTGYNVTVKEAKTPLDLDNMQVDIYVGITPNIL